jgi:hypothetical protein
MEYSGYRVDPRLIPPVALAMVFGIALLCLEGPVKRGFLMLLLLAPFFYLGAEILARKIVLDERGITISKFLRSVRLEWSEIQSLDAVRSGSKLFVILLGDHGRPVLVTNTIRSFSELVSRILKHVPKEKIADGAVQILSDPPSKTGPLVQAWIVCLVLAALVVGKSLGFG